MHFLAKSSSLHAATLKEGMEKKEAVIVPSGVVRLMELQEKGLELRPAVIRLTDR